MSLSPKVVDSFSRVLMCSSKWMYESSSLTLISCSTIVSLEVSSNLVLSVPGFKKKCARIFFWFPTMSFL
ncbi:hypothetical protein [Mycoplasmopsis pulmonis]|uniref:hypothetical protein n=1 Tax=Mycoplasmopsis pulmonis TaxID=2107 RepID=UPI00117D39A1|nr:hypothetical protein [Mycoplasmopsis pulmonis]